MSEEQERHKKLPPARSKALGAGGAWALQSETERFGSAPSGHAQRLTMWMA